MSTIKRARACFLGLTFGLLSTFASSQTLLTQTTSQVPSGIGIACNIGNIHLETSIFRVYDLAPLNLPGPISITAVQFGIHSTDSNGDGSQPLTVKVHSHLGPPFPGGTLTLEGSQQIQLPDQPASLFTLPLALPTQPLPPDSVLVLEVAIPDGTAANHVFFFGTNQDGQSGPSFIQAPDCGALIPTDLANLGFPTTALILNAVGTVTPAKTLDENLACARDGINALMPPVVVGPAQKNMLLGLLNLVSTYQSGPYASLGKTVLNSLIARVDGCALRAVPDTLGTQGAVGMDLVTTCPGQLPIFACLSAARNQLNK